MLKILMITGDAGEAQEIYYAKFRLEEEGWQVHIAAPEKRAFLSVVHDFEPGFDTYTEKPGYRVQADLGLDDVVAERTTGWCSRAAGPRNTCGTARRRWPSCATSSRAGKPIAANCHGPLLILAAGGGRGRTMTAYPELQPDLRSQGAEFVNRDVVVDGPLVTVRGWPDNGPWMREFVRLLNGVKP